MSTRETILRDAPLEGAALDTHLRAVATECRKTGFVRLKGIRRAMRSLDVSLAILRARHDAEELTPASLWLVDNARLIEEACVTLQQELRAAPRLPAHRGEARVSRLAREWISHTDARVDGDALMRAATAWQAARALDEVELCLLPLAFRRCLVLLLSDLAAHSAETERERTHAEASLDIAAENRPDAYFERLSCVLQEREDADALSLLDNRLLDLGTTATRIADREHDRQTRACLWTGNAIASLRAVSALEWRASLEALSPIDAMLRKDPTGVYPRMDFASRGMYRSRAAKIARQFRLSEAVVASRALLCAEEGADDTLPELSRHVGYYLMDEGQPLLWKALGKTPPRLKRLRALGAHAALIYVLMILIGSTATGVLLYFLGIRHWLVAPAMLVAGEGFRQLAGLLIHRLSPPRRMARLAPDQLDPGDVLVVVPTLLTGRAQALEMARHLSVLRLANPESRLSYMLLGDFKDGPAAVDPNDAEITDAALSAVRALNDVWNGGFYYLHREREWNERAKRYMGRERKRGALCALNDLLLTGACKDRFAAATCEASELKGRFELVITLDADTQLPPGTALELAGMLTHPLNRPCTAKGKRRGCAVIQPRMETSAATVHTRIARLWGGDGGFDPYTTAFSDIYQNLCGEGSFAGKGIYHPQAFEERSRGKILDNTVLSHDLLEGGLVGSSLACDVSLYDSQPASLSGWMKRLHRWTRGDWQLLPWLLPWVKTKDGWGKNPLSMLNQFKVYDNLRRSLVPAACALLLIVGVWANLPAAFLSGLLLPHVRALLPVSRKSLLAAGTHLALLPYEAVTLLDAALRTLWRVLFSRKRLLEWVPSQEAERHRPANSPLRFFTNFLAATLLVIASLRAPLWLLFTLPLSALWGIAPLLAEWLDAKEKPEQPLDERRRDMLLSIARRTFRFFEEMVTAETHHLPPDNLQLEPPRGIAPRTSPTNIGMYLIACVSACELSLLDADTMARRIEPTVSTMERMEKWHGHLFNWYDIRTLAPLSRRYVSSVDSGNLAGCLLLTAQAVRSRLSEVDASLLSLPARLDALAASMDFSRLYDPTCDLFFIGVQADTGEHGQSHYDLLASEARLLSYIALMRREVPIRHWRRLGRAMTKTRRGAALLSWSGTMFEYLLPALFLKSPDKTLLGDTCQSAVLDQIGAFGDGPWGVSESGYYAFDLSLSYQYRAFGLPRLALRTARAERVIAPYASALALALRPREACDNLEAMAKLGWLSDFGFFEAADYERERLPEGCEYRLVQSHMAHHQGMILASICNLLTKGQLTRHFHSLPQAEAYQLLLEERKPTRAMLRGAAKTRKLDLSRQRDGTLLRHVSALDFPPEAQVLYGGGTTMVLDARGGGYLSHNGVLLTRRRLDPLYDGGFQCYVRFFGGETVRLNRAGDCWFDRSRATYRLESDGVEAELVCFVSPLDGAAVHLLKLRAAPDRPADVEVASFFEVCLSSQVADESHPAFRNLSVETARLGGASAVARRRPKHAGERYPLLLHALCADKEPIAGLETSRRAFLGRGERLDAPRALAEPFDVSAGETGAVLDPCMSLRSSVHIEEGTSVSVWFVTAAVTDEEKARALVSQYASHEHVLRALELSATQDEVTAKYLGLNAAAQLAAQRMASWLLMPLAQPDPPQEDRSALWRFSISGDLPVVVVRISREAHLPLARAAIKAHAYLRALGLWSDLALLNEQPSGYHQPVRDGLTALLLSGPSRDVVGQSAGPHLIDREAHPKEAIQSLLSHAALVLRGGEGSLPAQLAAARRTLPLGLGEWKRARAYPAPHPAKAGSLGLDNRYGGFRADGGYVVKALPPAPWCNVLANERFGTVLTERGAGFTFADNSRLKRVTAFASDPVRDQRQENLWLRDETDGQYVSAFDRALVTHGFGVSRFESEALGLRLTLDVFVDEHLPVKCFLLTVENLVPAPRSLSVTACVRWLLGSHLHDAAQVRCEALGGSALARSPMFSEGAFLAFPGRKAEVSLDGAAFFGLGLMQDPPGMRQKEFAGSHRDIPAGIVRTHLTLGGEESETVCALLGVGDPQAACKAFSAGGAQLRLSRVREMWQRRQEALLPRVPDPAVSLLLSGWLPYQALSSRIFAHAGFYQAGGAIGFRDQLQDMLAFRFTEPERVRAHLLDAAAHQFEDGDVQHWWHPPALGVRTHITDDRLFLPYVTAAYLRATEDLSVLSMQVPYLENVDIPEGHEDWYGQAKPSSVLEPLHLHNLRAIDSLRYGEHGLPLIGGGDWNDGMNGLGVENRGESVWLGFFLSAVIRDYAPYCAPEEAKRLLKKREELMDNLEAHAWDGAWYLRAWFDGGVPLGSRESPECRIDLVVQAWAALAGAKRADQALDSALSHLLDERAGILKLLDPPFDGKTDPGYIRAYPPGIRENGGQYTHAALWFVMALFKAGRTELAWKLFFMLLPTTHSRDEKLARHYRVEPYVVAADVAGGEHPGLGGWTWYSGSASLLWSLGVETLLGFEKRGNRVRLTPTAPSHWEGFTLSYRHGQTTYLLKAVHGARDDGWIDLKDDGGTHEAIYALKS